MCQMTEAKLTGSKLECARLYVYRYNIPFCDCVGMSTMKFSVSKAYAYIPMDHYNWTQSMPHLM